MTTTVHSTDRSAQEVRRHPVRGGIYGFLLGFSVALWLILFAVIPFGDWIVLGIVVLFGIAIGVVWAYVGPAKQPAEPPPVVRRTQPPAPTVDTETTATAATDRTTPAPPATEPAADPAPDPATESAPTPLPADEPRVAPDAPPPEDRPPSP